MNHLGFGHFHVSKRQITKDDKEVCCNYESRERNPNSSSGCICVNCGNGPHDKNGKPFSQY